MMSEEVMIQQWVVLIEEVIIQQRVHLCKHSENQWGGWGGATPPKMLEEVMIQQRVMMIEEVMIQQRVR